MTEKDFSSPSLLNQALEARVGLEIAMTCSVYPLLRKAPRGDGHPVLVLPGFLTNSLSTALLRRLRPARRSCSARTRSTSTTRLRA